ncbi:MAG: lamin tail domain-containing protein [Candidatus Berkelbacteria bacterium]
MFRRFFIFFIFSFFVLFLNFSKVQAASQSIFINELMWSGGKTSYDEWVELYNAGDTDVDISGWQITYLSGGTEKLMLTFPADSKIESDSYFLISHYAKGSSSILDISPDLVDKGVSLSNDTLQIKLYKGDWQDKTLLVDVAGDGKTPLAGKNTSSEKFSMERTSDYDDGSLSDSWQTAVKLVNLLASDTVSYLGTPGEENSSKPKMLKPLAPTELLPDNKSIENTQNITFSWQEKDTQNLTYEFLLSKNEDLSDPIVDEVKLSKLEYNIPDLTWGDYYWQVIATNDTDKTESEIYKISLVEPVYSDAIAVNELMADPSGDETTYEWIELYNKSDEKVDLSGWYLEDMEGAIKRYQITDGQIEPLGYLIFARSKTGITLNNDKDGVRLYYPNDKIAYETPVFSGGKETYTWARNSSNDWAWTSKATSGEENIFYLPAVEVTSADEEEKPVINKKPIKIKTKDYKHNKDKLVEVEGEVTQTAGNTFYLNDGSGQVKIYIQAKTEIKKPPMRKGDIFGVIGVVNLYRETWRILPRVQDDIWIIKKDATTKNESEPKPKTVKKSVVASSVQKNTGANKPRAPAATDFIGQAKAASVNTETQSNLSENQDNSNPVLVQIAKFLIGLGVIFMLLLVIKIKGFERINITGGHFGDDDT